MKRGIALAAIVIGVLFAAAPAYAHPLGNFTINTYDGLRVSPSVFEVFHVIDMAEIPTFQQRGLIDINHDGTISDAESSAYASATCASVARQVTTLIDNNPVVLSDRRSALAFPPGAGGLPTMRITCLLQSGLAHGEHRVSFNDPTFADHIGWHEVTAVGDYTTLTGSSVPATSVSARLTRYPQELLRSPLDVRRASFTVSPGGSAARAEGSSIVRLQARGVDRATQAFTGLVARQRLTVAFGALALLLAVLLGAVHALAPGHGKTVMAAYLVGQRGSARQAAVIAGTVTVTHTAGVVALGVLLSASSAVATEKLYPWLGLASGVMICSIGASLLRRALHARAHAGHEHHPHVHEPVRARSLVGLGLAGGMVPSPSALVVLLAAIALHRLWFGVVLVVAYGAGMAGALTGIGLFLVRARGAFAVRPRLARLTAVLPVATATVVLAAGAVLAARGAVAI